MPLRPNPLSRSKHNTNRLSAVYIGSNPATAAAHHQLTSSSPSYTTSSGLDTPQIPDLPEPPSPGASSNGLPSPPATNSTDSGSTGDPQTIGIRERPISFTSSSGSSTGGSFGVKDLTSMLKGPNVKALHRSSSSISSTSSNARPVDRQGTFDQEHHTGNADLDEHNEHNEEEEEGDDTARLDLRRPLTTNSKENMLALQRVKSLTQRNQMALDKLSAYPRTGTPVSSSSRSPVPSHMSSASGSSTTKSTTSLSRPSRRSLPSHSTFQSNEPSRPDPNISLSGSETERESESSFHSHNSQHLRTLSSKHRPQTPPTPNHPRTRVPSAPTSPLKALAANNTHKNGASDISSNGSSPSRRRKRVSLANSVLRDESEDVYAYVERRTGRARSSLAFTSPEDRLKEGDATQPALAAVTSSRQWDNPSGTGGGRNRTRTALPLEFRGDLVDSERMSVEPEPMTPYRSTSIAFTSSNSSSASQSASGSGLGRSSTLREIRFSQSKWASEDLTNSSAASSSSVLLDTTSSGQSIRNRNTDVHRSEPRRAGTIGRGATIGIMGMAEYRERRQSLRGGSAESALAPGRSLIGEELRAAGLSPTRNRIQRLSLGNGDVFRRAPQGYPTGWDSDEGDDDGSGSGERGVRRAITGTLINSRAGTSTARAATSMADYKYLGRDDEQDIETRRALRSSRSAFPLRPGARESPLTRRRELSLTREDEARQGLEVERAPSSMSRYGTLRSHLLPDHQTPQRYASPFGNKRPSSTVPPTPASKSAGTVTQEHTRLLAESLVMFEGHLARLGLEGSDGGELVRSAQGIAGAAERLNNMLRYGATRAVEEQVNAEVEDVNGKSGEVAELWGRVGGEYREGLRVSDDLVRSLTGFLLSVGKIVRDLSTGGKGDSGQHARSVSLDDEGLRMGGRTRGSMSPDVIIGGPGSTGGGSGSGRRSVESRRSWEPPRDGLRDGRILLRADSALGQARPLSSLNTLREREREINIDRRYETPPSPSANTSKHLTDLSTRRLLTSREQRETPARGIPTIHSQETLDTGYEPSPTPAPRSQHQTTLGRSRTLPPLAIPKPLPTLPSESILRRNQTVLDKSTANLPNTGRNRDRDRRHISTASVSTIRGNTNNFPASLTPSSATTAITPHTVSTTHTPDKPAFPSSHRTDSDKSTRSNVTFSRPSTISISALNGLQQHLNNERKRTISGTSSGAEPSTSIPPDRGSRVLSGSETEKDTRRRTLGARAGRMSLDGEATASVSGSRTPTVHAADRSAAIARAGGAMLPPMNTMKRERRRTVTDIWPKE